MNHPFAVVEITPEQSIGTLSICENPEQYVQFTLDGALYYFVPGEFAEFQASYNPVQDRIYLGVIGGQFMNETQFGLLIEGSVPGTYSVGGNPFAYSFLVQGTDGSVYLNVDITEAGNSIGAMVEGSIEDGQFNDAGGISHTLSNCSFRMAIN